MHVIIFIISTTILIVEGLILNHMGYSIVNWEYWAILILTLCYMSVYVLMDWED